MERQFVKKMMGASIVARNRDCYHRRQSGGMPVGGLQSNQFVFAFPSKPHGLVGQQKQQTQGVRHWSLVALDR